jgi:hypothetical protein
LRHLTRSPEHFHLPGGMRLRPYQLEPFLAIIDSVRHQRGLSFVVVFPRQSGKNETQAALLAYLLYRFKGPGGEMVSVSPTYKPQTENAIHRLGLRLRANPLTRELYRKTGYIFNLGAARVSFFSGEPGARVVSASASLLLSVDEAQDVSIDKYDRDFEPMAASTNATRVFWGTRWTSDTLLERELTAARAAQEADGRRRVFFLNGDEVAAALPPYAEHLRGVIAKLGRDHPLVKTQYFCETLDAEAGMFSPSVLVAIDASTGLGTSASTGLSTGASGDHAYDRSGPQVILIDVAGQDRASLETRSSASDPGPGRVRLMSDPERDTTAVVLAGLDLSSLPLLGGPTYHVHGRFSWTGRSHVDIFGQLKAMAENLRPLYIVVDATGVGEGLWALLDHAFPGRVIPVKFSARKKSDLGWRFLAIAGTGRFRDHCHSAEVHTQYLHCRAEILPGPGRLLRWGVPDGLRDRHGQTVHDDYVMADALVAELDTLPWSAGTETTIIEPPDPLEGMDGAF